MLLRTREQGIRSIPMMGVQTSTRSRVDGFETGLLRSTLEPALAGESGAVSPCSPVRERGPFFSASRRISAM